MSTVNVLQNELWEELPDKREHVVGDVLTLGPTDEECRPIEPGLVGILEGKVTHVVKA